MNTSERRCNKCKHFSHALEAMTDHVNYHSCNYYKRPLETIQEARTCSMFRKRRVNESQ